VKYLIDTHVFLWWVLDDPQLSTTCREIMSDGENRIYFSAASAWEIAIKAQIGKLPLPEPPSTYVPDRVNRNGFTALPITLDHTLHTYSLPLHHRDPFDRILVAQSELEDLPILTADDLIAQCNVRIIW
jgi:PIN domain nuclease of toxin-antitoxin system